MNVHITGFSTVIIEAEQFGVPSICISNEAVERYTQQLSNNTLFEAYTKEAISEKVTHIINTSKPETAKIDSRPPNPSFLNIINRIHAMYRTNQK